MIRGAWRYRYFICSSIKTEFRTQFVRSRLGGLWMILQPLSQVLMFAFVLSAVLSAKLPGITNRYAYAIYLMAGTLGWSLFSEMVTRCTNVFIENGNLLKKLVFPKIALPLIVTGSALINNGFLFLTMIFIFALLGHMPGEALIWLPLLTLINVTLALGVGLTLGVVNVFIRDIGQIVPFLLQLLFWFTPIVYMLNIIPQHYQHWLVLNPMIILIRGYQNILLYNLAPNFIGLAVVFLVTLFLLAFSLFLFRKASSELVDQL